MDVETLNERSSPTQSKVIAPYQEIGNFQQYERTKCVEEFGVVR